MPVCSVATCGITAVARGLCSSHYEKAANRGEFTKQLCRVEGCSRNVRNGGMCNVHRQRVAKHGDPLAHLPPVAKAPSGTGCVVDGYRRHSVGGISKLEHRLIVEKIIGRPLKRVETVHHKNGDRLDNRLTPGHELKCPSKCCNLELWSKAQPSGQRVADKLAWCREFLALYGNQAGPQGFEEDHHLW